MCRKDINYYNLFMNILVDGVKPALGCTEPVAVALGVAKAIEDIKGDIESIKVKVSPNIYKNGMGVGIPGTKEIGLDFAAALGATCGDSSLGLEVLKKVNKESIKKAETIIKNDKVFVTVDETEGNFYIESTIKTSKGKGISIIRESHTNIVYVETNGEVKIKKDSIEDEKNGNGSNDLKNIKFSEIREFVENVPFEEIRFLLEGVKVNMDIAEVGLKERSGVGLGAALNEMVSDGVIQKDLVNEAKVLASAACDARMAGVNMPVMSSGGSGNQGITAIIPPAVVCDNIGCDDEKLARTLAYSHIVSTYIKTYTGKLAPVCGCAISAGIGASSAITWTLGGNDEQIGYAVKNMVGTLAGMVCDGAKGGCAFKIATATSEAIIQAKLAMNNIVINNNDGILSPSTEQTVKNLGQFCNEGMKNADEEIIKIMVEN